MPVPVVYAAFQVALPPDVGPLFHHVSFSTGLARVRVVRTPCPPIESFLRGGGASRKRRISRSRASGPCMGPFDAFDSAVDKGAQSALRRQPRLRNGVKLHDKLQVTTTPRHRDSISCHAPRASDLTSGLVRGPVQLLARPAAVLDALARTALGAGAAGAARARAAAALASPGRACAQTRGSGTRAPAPSRPPRPSPRGARESCRCRLAPPRPRSSSRRSSSRRSSSSRRARSRCARAYRVRRARRPAP